MIATSQVGGPQAIVGCADPMESAQRVLARFGEPSPEDRFELQGRDSLRDATATSLMDFYRRTHDDTAFEALIALVGPALETRVRTRLRCSGARLDPDEVLQDVVINVYRYPARFDASRPGAFRAWSSTIVDNTIRRQLRKTRRALDVQLRPNEHLTREADAPNRNPYERVQTTEACEHAYSALQFFLGFYIAAFQALSERERFVLQMVEVRGMRYAELAEVLGIRPEALKMVVFRARRRILDRVQVALGVAA